MWVLMDNVGKERTVEVNYVFLVIYFAVFLCFNVWIVLIIGQYGRGTGLVKYFRENGISLGFYK